MQTGVEVPTRQTCRPSRTATSSNAGRVPVRRPDILIRTAVSGRLLELAGWLIQYIYSQRAVRAHLVHLVGRNNILTPTVTTAELQTFAELWANGQNYIPCCTAEDFKIDLITGPRSAWNQSAARVFANHFLAFHGIERTYDALQRVMDHFHTCIKGLKAKRSKGSSSAWRQRAKTALENRKQRKRYV